MTRYRMAAALIACGVFGGVPQASAQQAAAPTYTKDIAPILYANCASCHRPGEIAPMSLMN